MTLRQRLAGKRILLTGVTGFVGEALCQRILEELPETKLVVLVRPKGNTGGRKRVEQLLNKPAFGGLKEQHGGLKAIADERIEVIEGDLAAVPDLPADVAAVVHCAGDVSFDPTIEEAFTTNVRGTVGLLDKVRATGAQPHYVHVSTAYVAGRRRGAIPEASVGHGVDWREEEAYAGRLRERIEEASRAPGTLAKLRRQAEKEHHRAGPLTAAGDAERRRKEWVSDQLKAAGRERARSLGWTDVYTFTKAMGERVVEEHGHEFPVSIVRPSIIESAYERPYAGWIEGFKMAEPLILAYGKGELPEFPASPDSVIDIVPVDHVVAAILAVVASPPETGDTGYFHVTSGARNPLTFSDLVHHVKEYFERNPFEGTDGRGVPRLPSWSWPGGESVERLLRTGERLSTVADKVVTKLPRSNRVRRMASDLGRQQRRLEFLRKYMDLYRPYAECELEFTDDRTLQLYRDLPPEDREHFAFDTSVVDWKHYLIDVHCASVTQPMRALDAARRRRGNAAAKSKKLEAGDQVVAAFDMDGTLLSSNVIETYLWLRLPELAGLARAQEVGTLARKLPSYLMAERRDRGGFLRAVYRRYEGASLAELNQLVDEDLSDHLLERLSGGAVRRIREHRAAGHKLVLITGAIRPLTRPLQPLFDEIVAADLSVDAEGRCTGFLSSPPLVGEARAAWLTWYAGQQGLDLSQSFAYADSHSDLPLLKAVGNPVAVSPDVPLWREARKSRWPVQDWAEGAKTTSRFSLPGSSS
ncbi:MAG: HAD-IB family phosphatase [Streptosporangiales bacterium]|nr:HAD-IB family phosphatase [Streptosporangiales bacterium]